MYVKLKDGREKGEEGGKVKVKEALHIEMTRQ